MATLPELETALRNADAAGDADAARQLAAEYVRLRGGQNTSGQATAPANMPQSQAAMVGIGQGLSANFADEIGGGVAAVNATRGINPTRGVAGMTADAVLGISQLVREMASGQRGPATEAYEQTRDAMRQEAKTAQERHPGTVLAGNIVGGAVFPGGAAMQGATMPARMVRSAVVGGAYGGASGVGEGETAADRLTRGASGLAVGGGVGAVAPPIIGAAARGAGALVAPVTNAVRGLTNVDAQAGRRIIDFAGRGRSSDPNAITRLRVDEFGDAQRSGQPVMLMDIMGEPGRALARSSANTSAEGRDVLNRSINDRFEGQFPRVRQWFEQQFGTHSVDDLERSTQGAARMSNSAAYTRAYQEGAEGVWSPGLERLSSAPAVTAAMQRAAKNAGDEAVVSGYGAMNPRITFTDDGRIQFNRAPNGMPTYPDLQYWDLVRRELSDAAQRAGRGTSESRRLGQLATRLNAELDSVVPSYRAARESAAGFFGSERAIEAGQNFVRLNSDLAQARRAFSQMSAADQELFRQGFTAKFLEDLSRVSDRRNILLKIDDAPLAREKLEMVLGSQRWAELEARLRVEGIMDLARGAVQGNSSSIRQWAELGLAGTTGVYGVSNLDPTTLTISALVAGRRGIDQRVARRVAEMLTSSDPQILERGFRIVSRNQRMMENLRSFDKRIATVSGQQGTGAVVTQGPVRATAEQEQQ